MNALTDADRINRHNEIVLRTHTRDAASTMPWKRGLPPGDYYDGMTHDFEVHFTAGGRIWHRRRSEADAQVSREVFAELGRIASGGAS